MSYLRFRQICLVAPKLSDVEQDISDILEAKVCFRDPAVGKYGLENALWSLGPMFLEVVAPIAENTAAQRFLDKSDGRGGYMAIFDCDNPRERGAHCEAMGVKKIVDHTHGIYTGVQLHPRDCRGAMIEFNRTEGGAENPDVYGPAGPDWKKFAGSPTRIARVAMEGAQDLGTHWSRITQQPLVPEAGGALALRFAEAEIAFEPGAREIMAELVVTTPDAAAMRARAEARGRGLSDGAFEIAGVRVRPVAAP